MTSPDKAHEPRGLWSDPVEVAAGGLLWVVFVRRGVPSVREDLWVQALVCLAALVVLPILLPLTTLPGDPRILRRLRGLARRIQFPAGVLLVLAFRSPQGVLASVLALPWAFCLCVHAATGAFRLWRAPGSPSNVAMQSGLVFGGVGAAWTVCDRLGLRPLGFEPAIVLLTAAHFHFAGVVLPIVTGRSLGSLAPSGPARALSVLTVAAVPAVAAGITLTQLGSTFPLEAFAGCALSVCGLATGLLQVAFALNPGDRVLPRILMGVGGLALMGAMLLSTAYSARFFSVALPWLDLGWMRALHGSANALGFGLCASMGWRLSERSQAAD